ncbi:antibiotic transporter [Sulfodiicoccus acidiphilus]|uniref:Antibiotic transporter n=1 Tax=Sulfodiicoccus acidiphilus TaxID=1670455 RepID=A0A830GYF3_9CREN|nr:antibiotic transporter [Sulfodiicoccus acidiphilus]
MIAWVVILVLATLPALNTPSRLVYTDSPFLSRSFPSQEAQELLKEDFPSFYPNYSTLYVIFVGGNLTEDGARLAQAARYLYRPILLSPPQIQYEENETAYRLAETIVEPQVKNLTTFYLAVHELYLKLNQSRTEFMRNLSVILDHANQTFTLARELDGGPNYTAAYNSLSRELNGTQLILLKMMYGNLTKYGNVESAAAHIGASYFKEPVIAKLGFSNFSNASKVASLLPNSYLYQLNSTETYASAIGDALGIPVNSTFMVNPSLVQVYVIRDVLGNFLPPTPKPKYMDYLLFAVEVPPNESLADVELFSSHLNNAYVTGHLPIYAESAFATSSELEIVDLITILAVVLLLTLLLRAVVPILTLVITAGSALDLAYGLTYVSSLLGYRMYYISGFVVAPIVFGLTVDYSMLLLYRYFEGLRTAEGSLDRALRSSRRTVYMSGISVTLGFSSFLLTPSPLLRNIGLSLIIAAASSVAASTTFYPSLLSIVNPRTMAFPRRELPDPDDVRQSYLEAASTFAVRKKWLVVGLMIALTAGSLLVLVTHPTNLSVGEILPSGSGAVKGEAILSSMYNYSQLYAITSSQEQTKALTKALLEEGAWVYGPYSLGRGLLSRPLTGPFYRDGHYLVEAIVPGAVFSNEAIQATARVTGLGLVGGSNAQRLDIVNNTVFSYFHYTLPITVVLILAYLFVAMGSAITPPRLAATVLVSSLAGVATVELIFGSVYWLSPLIVFALMFSLGIDYDVFLVSRIMEEEGGDEEVRVIRAVKSTGLVITAAGLVLGVAFFSLTTANMRFLEEIGVGVGVSVLVDTFVVRTVFVPAVMAILKELNWWPKKRVKPS